MTMCTSIAFEKRCPSRRDWLVQISDRHFGVGGDGLILILPSDRADVRMRMFNADGSEAQMCGNGIRCLAKYVYMNQASAGSGDHRRDAGGSVVT